MNNFGERLKEKMDEKGMSQVALAKALGCKQPDVSRWVTGKNEPRVENVQRIAEVLECDVKWLLGKEIPEQTTQNYSSAEIYRGDIYYVKMTNRVFDTGVLDAGRPAIVVSNNQGNYHSNYVQVVYLTTKEKKPLPTHVSVICKVPSTAMCEQIQTVSKDRLVEFIRTCTEKEMERIDKALTISLGLENEVNDVYGAAKLEDENKELKMYLKEAKEEFWKLNESHKRTSEEYAKLQVKYEELANEAILPEDYDPAETLKLKTERDTYKQQYEALLDRLIGK